MFSFLTLFRHRLVFKVMLTAGITLLAGVAIWSYSNIRFEEKRVMEKAVSEVDRLSNTIKLGTHYAMMLDSEDDIQQIISNIARQKEIRNIRIYNKNDRGTIQFSNDPREIGKTTDIKEQACFICHQAEPPLSDLALEKRTRIFLAGDGKTRLLGIMSPIPNEESCNEPCHVHPPEKTVLGLLDVVFSLEDSDSLLASYRITSIAHAVFIFLATFFAFYFFINRFIKRPIKKLMVGTRQIARGRRFVNVDVTQDDEIGELAQAINRMGTEVLHKHQELDKQRIQYQSLFEGVPCIITVQDRSYKLISYNREFSDKFDARIGAHCYKVYKGRDSKCEECPVEKTFEDGLSHYSEETGRDKDGSAKHWIVTTAPIYDDKGNITAAMEMCLDITPRKQLEEKLELSERKYQAIYENIPDPVFVLDRETLRILDCNNSAIAAYGYPLAELKTMSFLDFFPQSEQDQYAERILRQSVITQAKHATRDGAPFYVSIRVSPAEFPGRDVLLVVSTDITKRLETEQQLIQAAKMATLGEMSTGVAHELNQPLSIIQTISQFFMRKLRKNQSISPPTFQEMAEGINSQVERAAKIITHMREFGRKSDLKLEHVHINEVIEKAFDLFSQQLKLRNIEVIRDLAPNLPPIMAEHNRLEQVFINLLINARDAIEERWNGKPTNPGDKQISLKTYTKNNKVFTEIRDTGPGIPKAIADKLFEPFFTTKEVGKGTGLGLSISYGIIQDYNGAIRTVLDDTQGACFVIQFPAAEPARASERTRV